MCPRPVRPCLEALEDRRVPTCTALQFAGSLTITGTDQADVIRIDDNGFGGVSVLCDTDVFARVFTGVTAISVNAQRGRDTVVYNLRGNVFNFRSLRVDLGSGDDTFLAFFNSFDLPFGANFQMSVLGRSGRDTIAVDATRGVDVGTGAVLGLDLRGGLGGDRIDLAHDGAINGALSAVANGGFGPDQVSENFNVAANSGGQLFARTLGGRAADALTLNVIQPPGVCIVPPCTLTLDAVLDGGPGTDTCTATPNVRRFNCP
jgi:hypothetical protein